MINVGRPDKLPVTLNGSAVPPLGTGERAIKDVPVGAAALAARAGGQPGRRAVTDAEPARRRDPGRSRPHSARVRARETAAPARARAVRHRGTRRAGESAAASAPNAHALGA